MHTFTLIENARIYEMQMGRLDQRLEDVYHEIQVGSLYSSNAYSIPMCMQKIKVTTYWAVTGLTYWWHHTCNSDVREGQRSFLSPGEKCEKGALVTISAQITFCIIRMSLAIKKTHFWMETFKMAKCQHQHSASLSPTVLLSLFVWPSLNSFQPVEADRLLCRFFRFCGGLGATMLPPVGVQPLLRVW